MGMPKRTGAGAAYLLLAGCLLFLFTGCNSLMEADVPGDHPPVISDFQMSPATVGPDQPVQISYQYADAGGDLLVCFYRDDMAGAGSLWYTDQSYLDEEGNVIFNFPGTSGSYSEAMPFLMGTQEGLHHFTVFCLDTQGSLSNTLQGEVSLNLR